MDAEQRALWERLERFDPDVPGASLTFTHRLARENGWSHAFAHRVVGEYKRFVFLAMTAGHPVTPSDEVDQAWHLHLTYTRSYWQELCGEVLRSPLHHGPTRGGPAEGQRFERQYADTLASYRRLFGAEPPRDVWPPASVRFGEAPDFVRVNTQRVWVVPKWWRTADRRPLALAGAWLLVAPPLAAGAAWNPLDYDGPTFLTFYAAAAAIGVVGALVCRTVLRVAPRGGESTWSGDHEAIGALRSGWTGALHTALASLLGTETLRSSRERRWRKGHECRFTSQRPSHPHNSELQRALIDKAAGGGANLATLAFAGEPIAKRIEEDLAEAGLLETSETWRPVRVACGSIFAALLTVGVAKLVVGLTRDKPVGFLIGALLVTGIVALVFCDRPRRTPAGERRFKALLREASDLKARAKKKDTSLPPADLALAVGLFGVPACASLYLDDLRAAAQSTSGDAGGGGSADDGGGCGGGGCGGCGGCGG